MTFISYAQNYEDVTLWRALKHVKNGTYIDVGAQHPEECSVTKAFYDSGWTGINVEPVKQWFKLIKESRPKDINLNIALADKVEAKRTLFEVEGTGMSTCNRKYADMHEKDGFKVKKILVPTSTLSELCEKYISDEIHFLKIDVEGAEKAVLEGADFSKYRPWVILIEATEPNSPISAHKNWEDILLKNNYKFVWFDGLNRFYVSGEKRKELAKLIAQPPNIYDEFTPNTQNVYLKNIKELTNKIESLSCELTALESQKISISDELELTHQTSHRLLLEKQQLEADLSQVNTVLNNYIALWENSQNEVKGLYETRGELSTHISYLENEKNELIRKTKKTAIEISQLVENLEVAKNEGDKAKLKCEELSSQLSILEGQHSELIQQNNLNRQHIEYIDPKYSLLEDEHVRQVAQEQLYKRHIAYIEAKLLKIENSSSWKLVKPFRAGKRRYRKDTKKIRKALKRFYVKVFRPLSKNDGVKRTEFKVIDRGNLNLPNTDTDSIQYALSVGQRIIYYYVDHTLDCPVNTGVQRVTRNLATKLIDSGEKIVFVKWDAELNKIILLNRNDLDNLEKWQGPKLGFEDKAIYPAKGEKVEISQEHIYDEGHWLLVPEVPFITFHPEPVTLNLILAAKVAGLRSAFVFYDAIPLKRPEFVDIAPVHEEYMQHLLLADLIFPISDFSANDLHAFFKYRLGADNSSVPKIKSIRLPAESLFAKRVSEPLPKREKLILSVGTLDRRKNQLALVRAFLHCMDKGPDMGWKLILVGSVHDDIKDELHNLIKDNKAIELRKDVGDDELENLYEDCSFTVFPSVEEGFGLPILESLWHGKPCICASFGAMAEVAVGGGCIQVDVNNESKIANAVGQLINNPKKLEKLSIEAVERQLSSWADYAKEVSQLLDTTSDARSRIGTIYYLVEHTFSFAHNTGIQRVVRSLAKGLLESGYQLQAVKWNSETGKFYSPTIDELSHLSKWNGPDVNLWKIGELPERFSIKDWLLIPELTVYSGAHDLKKLKASTDEVGLRVAWIFYDAIPWKMSDIYPQHWGDAHAEYMRALNTFDLVLAISRHSRNDLKEYLKTTGCRMPEVDRRILACQLPGEFSHIKRITEVKNDVDDKVRILCVGSVELRKNQTTLINAFDLVNKSTKKNIELVIAGGCYLPEEYIQPFRDLVSSTAGVTWIESPDDKQLSELYECSDFSVYPSVEEGFGLPILESLWHCRPSICHNKGAMAEVAEGGGCLTADVTDVDALAEAISTLVDNKSKRLELAKHASKMTFRSWKEYANDVVYRMTNSAVFKVPNNDLTNVSLPATASAFSKKFINTDQMPLLSICISTYNRAPWLKVSLRNLERLIGEGEDGIEVVVCDNASTDNTSEIVKPYLSRKDFHYHRNKVNVGMLGNLSVTANKARGKYVWILGDDDLVLPGAIERILHTIKRNKDLALVYLNYSYTREDAPDSVENLDSFLQKGIPIVAPEEDFYGSVAECSVRSENFFTAIYCLVFRRDHAIKAYSQNTDGRPFSTMLTCIPTTYHVLNEMMDLPAAWIGEPQVVINMNVSWLKYASLWILERFPEVYDRAEIMGADPKSVDKWRINYIPHIKDQFAGIFENDPEENAIYFNPKKLVTRYKHLEEFRAEFPYLIDIYKRAHQAGKIGAELPVSQVFPALNVESRSEG